MLEDMLQTIYIIIIMTQSTLHREYQHQGPNAKLNLLSTGSRDILFHLPSSFSL